MSLAQRVAGIVANYLGEKDEKAVISEHVAPPMERFTPPSDADKTFLKVWSSCALATSSASPFGRRRSLICYRMPTRSSRASSRSTRRSAARLRAARTRCSRPSLPTSRWIAALRPRPSLWHVSSLALRARTSSRRGQRARAASRVMALSSTMSFSRSS